MMRYRCSVLTDISMDEPTVVMSEAATTAGGLPTQSSTLRSSPSRDLCTLDGEDGHADVRVIHEESLDGSSCSSSSPLPERTRVMDNRNEEVDIRPQQRKETTTTVGSTVDSKNNKSISTPPLSTVIIVPWVPEHRLRSGPPPPAAETILSGIQTPTSIPGSASTSSSTLIQPDTHLSDPSSSSASSSTITIPSASLHSPGSTSSHPTLRTVPLPLPPHMPVPIPSLSSNSLPAAVPPRTPPTAFYASMASRRLLGQSRVQLIDFLRMFLADSSALGPPTSNHLSTSSSLHGSRAQLIDPSTESDLFDIVDLFGGDVEAVIHTLLTLEELCRPQSFQQVLPTLIKYIEGHRRATEHLLNHGPTVSGSLGACVGMSAHELLDTPSQQAMSQDELLNLSLTGSALHGSGRFSTGLTPLGLNRSLLHHQHPYSYSKGEHETLSTFLASTSIVGLVTQDELDEMLQLAGGLEPLLTVFKTWNLVEMEESDLQSSSDLDSELELSSTHGSKDSHGWSGFETADHSHLIDHDEKEQEEEKEHTHDYLALPNPSAYKRRHQRHPSRPIGNNSNAAATGPSSVDGGPPAHRRHQSSPILISDLMERLRAHPWPFPRSRRSSWDSFLLSGGTMLNNGGGFRSSSQASTADTIATLTAGSSTSHVAHLHPHPGLGHFHCGPFPKSSDITDDERELVQTLILDLELMNHAIQPVIFTAAILDAILQASHGLFSLRMILKDLSKQKNFHPQNLDELVYLIETSRQEREGLRHGRRLCNPYIPLRQQIDRARREVERQDRAAAKAMEKLTGPEPPAVLHLADGEDEDGLLIEQPGLDELHQPMALLQFDDDPPVAPPNPLLLDQPEADINLGELNQPQQTISLPTLLYNNKLTKEQQNIVVASIKSSHILSRVTSDESELLKYDLNQLSASAYGLPSPSGHGTPAICAALSILGRNGVRCNSFQQLCQVMKQHYSYAQATRSTPCQLTQACCIIC